MQPRRPHGQRAPPSLTTTCPISPAPPRPSHGLPLRMMPPPTPVPQNTPRIERYARPAPRVNSASVATWTSFSILTRVPMESDSAPASANEPSQSGRLRALVTIPLRLSTMPGEPTPTPSSSVVSTPAAVAAARTASAMASATFGGPPAVGVGTRSSPLTPPPSSTTTAWILVPPRSIPPLIEATLTRLAAGVEAARDRKRGCTPAAPRVGMPGGRSTGARRRRRRNEDRSGRGPGGRGLRPRRASDRAEEHVGAARWARGDGPRGDAYRRRARGDRGRGAVADRIQHRDRRNEREHPPHRGAPESRAGRAFRRSRVRRQRWQLRRARRGAARAVR